MTDPDLDEEHDRIEFCIGEVFPAEDELAQWVMTLSIALGDLRIVQSYATRPEQPVHERGYFVRLMASHTRELVKVLELAVAKSDPLRDFIENTLSQDARDLYNEVQRRAHAPLALRPDRTLLDELIRIRNVTWHYPLEKDFVVMLRDAIRRAATTGDRGVYVLPDEGHLRADYADLIAHFLAYPLDGSKEETTAQFRELHERIVDLFDALGPFLQRVEGEYLERTGKTEFKPGSGKGVRESGG
jgi:hypothetical protein